jgi:hypothetical protein
MDELLRCHGCGLPIDLGDDVVNAAGRRFHHMCVQAPHRDPSGRPSGNLRRLRHWINNFGWGEAA